MAEENEGLFSDQQVSNAESIKNAMSDIRDATRIANKEMKELGMSAEDYGSIYSGIIKSANQVATIQREAATSSKATTKALNEEAKNRDKVKQLNAKINDLMARSVKLTGDAKDAVLAQAKNFAAARDNASALADDFAKIADDAAKLDSRTSFFSGIADVVGDIPGLRKLSGPFQDAAKAARETVISNKKTKKSVSVMGAGMKGFAKSAASSAMSFLKSGGYIGLIVMGLQKLVKLGLAADQSAADTAKAFNVTKNEGADINAGFLASNKQASALTQNMKAARELAREFANETGIMSDNAEVFNANMQTLIDRFDISKEQAFTLGKQMLATGQNIEDFATDALGAAEAFEMANGINVQQQAIMGDIASASAAFRLNSGGSAVELGRAAAQARKVGLSFTQLEKTSEGLLDFEKSLENQLQVRLLTNKEINLDVATQAALVGDLATVAQEIVKQEAVREAFATKNILAQNKIAETLSISRDELAEMFFSQQALEKSGFATAEAREEELQRLLKTMTLREALNKIGDEAFKTQRMNASFQEKINNLVNNLKDIFVTAIEPTVTSITSQLEKLGREDVENLVTKTIEFAQSLTGPEGKITNFLDKTQAIFNIFKGFGQLINAVLVQPLKVVGYSVTAIFQGLKSAALFLAGDVVGGMEAGGKAVDATVKAATSALDIGTGIFASLGTFGGADTNATGITDAYADSKASKALQDPFKVNDFTIQPLDKDTITMAGGTKLGGRVEELLEELIAEVRKGGDVFLDGNKVGETMVLNARTL